MCDALWGEPSIPAKYSLPMLECIDTPYLPMYSY